MQNGQRQSGYQTALHARLPRRRASGREPPQKLFHACAHLLGSLRVHKEMLHCVKKTFIYRHFVIKKVRRKFSEFFEVPDKRFFSDFGITTCRQLFRFLEIEALPDCLLFTRHHHTIENAGTGPAVSLYSGLHFCCRGCDRRYGGYRSYRRCGRRRHGSRSNRFGFFGHGRKVVLVNVGSDLHHKVTIVRHSLLRSAFLCARLPRGNKVELINKVHDIQRQIVAYFVGHPQFEEKRERNHRPHGPFPREEKSEHHHERVGD